MAFDATALMRARKPQGTFGGPDDGRPIASLLAGAAPASSLHMAGNPLLAAMAGAGGGRDLTVLNARRKNPEAIARRAARAKYAEQNQLASPDVRTWDAAHLQAARDLGLFGRKVYVPGSDTEINVGRQLANIRWHGNPDGPMDPEDLLGEVNSLRAAIRRPQTYATRS